MNKLLERKAFCLLNTIPSLESFFRLAALAEEAKNIHWQRHNLPDWQEKLVKEFH